mgnify:CR=1 FL=1
MEKAGMISEFLNGVLESEKEKEFFALLSSEPEMRNEFKDYLVMEDAIKAGKNYFHPSVD